MLTYQKHGLCQELVPKPVIFLCYHPQDHITALTGPTLAFLILFVPLRVGCRNCMGGIFYFEYQGMVSFSVLPVKLSFLFIFTWIFLFFWFRDLKMIFVSVIAKTSFLIYHFFDANVTNRGVGPAI